MSLEYYIYCRKSYDKIIQELDCIIDMFDEIDNFTFTEIDITYEMLNNVEQNKHFFIERKKYIEQLRKFCSDKVIELCCHEMVDDDIDITPERSQRIRYCDICEYTEQN